MSTKQAVLECTAHADEFRVCVCVCVCVCVIQFDRLPESFSNMRKLKELDLATNDFSQFPSAEALAV
jgi:hypothetical protein